MLYHRYLAGCKYDSDILEKMRQWSNNYVKEFIPE